MWQHFVNTLFVVAMFYLFLKQKEKQPFIAQQFHKMLSGNVYTLDATGRADRPMKYKLT